MRETKRGSEMKLWKIEQDVNDNYDTYDSAVVAAETAEAARLTHPGSVSSWNGKSWLDHNWADCTWTDPDNVRVTLIGEAVEGTPAGVIVASFNAG